MPPLGYFTRGASGEDNDLIIGAERAPYLVGLLEISTGRKKLNKSPHILKSKA